MQPFIRPGAQKGFAFHFNQNENFNFFRYTFNYTKNDSLCFFNKFEQGKKLWIKDILAEKTKNIASQTAFSIYTFNQTCIKYRVSGMSKNQLKSKLSDNGIKISTHINISEFSASECVEIVDKWNNQQKIQIINQIRRRYWHETIENSNQAGKKHEFRTTKMLMDIELLRLVGNRSNMEELDLKNSTTIHYSKNAISSNNKINESWEKVPRRFELAKSEKFLTESDCLI
jgi:hypothetical protein